MDIVMNRHALEQARERRVSINEIQETIRCGVKYLQQDKVVAMHRHIKIIFKKLKNKFFIITLMIRSEKNGK